MKEIVEIVGNPSRQLTDRLHLLGLDQLRFEPLAFLDRLGNARLQRLIECLGRLACFDVGGDVAGFDDGADRFPTDGLPVRP
ncbi:MAG: hypothetical protein VW935_17645 [Novosphingobium sp.]